MRKLFYCKLRIFVKKCTRIFMNELLFGLTSKKILLFLNPYKLYLMESQDKTNDFNLDNQEFNRLF